MNTEIVITGVSHHQADIAVRELFSVPPERIDSVVKTITSCSGVRGVVLLSTCNRLEVIAAVEQGAVSQYSAALRDVFEEIASIPREQFLPLLFSYSGEEAVCHLFRVSAGLDSLVVGEPQILGQLKAAYHDAQRRGSTTPLLNRFFHRAFGAAKSIRTNTRIGHHAVSVCFAARELAKQIFGDLVEARVMLVGAGETGELALKHFQAAGVRTFFLVNRSMERALELSQRVKGVVVALDQLPEFLYQADIVIGASGLPERNHYLVTEEHTLSAFKDRPGKPQFYIDLGVPRNFSPEIGNLPDAFLYNIDDLKQIVDQNMSDRMIERRRAEIIVREEVEKFMRWLHVRHLEPAVKGLKRQVELFQEQEMRKTLRRLKQEGFSELQCERLKTVFEDHSQGLLSKVLHRPITYVKHAALFNPLVETVFRDLFLRPQRSSDSDPEVEAAVDESVSSDDEMSSIGASKSWTRRGLRL